ncbi:MAG: hypothetical protein Kow0074_09300 [Candidatus Zixiibacteriota bacterium]
MMVTTTTILDSRDSHPARQRAGCDTRDHAKGVITLRNTILRLTRGAVFAGIALLLGMTPALGQVAGTVTALDGSPLDGAVIEVWDSYPDGNVLDQTTSDVLGDFSLSDPGVGTFDLRTWATDYYPTVVRGLPNNTENTLVKLIGAPAKPAPTGPLFPNDFWGQSSKFLGALVRPGDVIEATDPGDVLLDVAPAAVIGGYLIHAVSDDLVSPEDDGGTNGETVSFKINGLPADPDTTFISGSNTHHEIESVLDHAGVTVTAPPNIGGVAGDAVLIQFRVENTGNITATFDVTVDIDLNWAFTMRKSIVTLNPGEAEIVDVFVDIPANATGGFATATVHAIADNYSPANSGAKTQIDVNPTDVNDGGGSGSLVPNSFSLAQNYPNPFNPETQIAFTLAAPGRVRLEVFNVIGQSVAVLVDGYRDAGETIVEWNGRNSSGHDVPSGVYFYRLTREDDALTRKMVLMR